MRKLVLLVVAALFVSVHLFAQQYDLSELPLDEHIEKLVKILFDTTNEKLKGFDRVDVGKYEQLGFNTSKRGRSYAQRITLYVERNNKMDYLTAEYVFGDGYNARRHKGEYLTALENNGFIPWGQEDGDIIYSRYTEDFMNLTDEERRRKLNTLSYNGLLTDDYLTTPGVLFSAFVRIWEIADEETDGAMIKVLMFN